MLKVTLALISEWRIAVPAIGEFAGEQLFEHGESPKRNGSPLSPENYVAARKRIIATRSPAPRAQNISPDAT
jgi:hypothetical protein